jgi:drug/metabolite transporter (DMT)-like permease
MKLTDWGRLFLLAVLWGGSYYLIRIVAPELGAFLTMSLRTLVAAITLIVYGLVTRQFVQFCRHWQSYTLLGLLNNAIPFVFIAIAVINLNASIAAILNATTPLFTAIVSALWLRERLRFAQVIGLGLGVLGVTILVGWSPLPLTPAVVLGGILALLAAASYGVAAVYARRTFPGQKSMDVATGQLLASSVLLLPLGIVSVPAQMPPSEVIWGLIGLAIACTAFAYLLYFQLIANAGATQAATVTFLVPVFGVLFGRVLLGEPITWGLVLGLATILLSVWLVIQKKQPRFLS